MDRHLYKMHHKIKLKLDAICLEAGDLNVEEFMQVYKSLKQDVGKMRAEQIESKIRDTEGFPYITEGTIKNIKNI